MAIKKSQLYSSLWKSCDELRGGMDASQYKDYVLILLFIKYISDKAEAKEDALIEIPEGSSFKAITLGPVAVLPEYQRKGIGSQLVRAGLEECGRLGHEIVVLAGHPEYYPRFGFVTGKSKGIDCEFECPEEAWMILELREGALAGRHGKVIFQPEFKDAV